jgi:diguanylate cyclase (GGDEF)-like protein
MPDSRYRQRDGSTVDTGGNPRGNPRGNSDMSEDLKICVIYRDEPPEVLDQPTPDAVPWRFEICAEDAVLRHPASTRQDCFAVLFPWDGSSELRDVLAGIFPAAEFIGYSNPGAMAIDEPLRKLDGTLVVRLPMTLSFARQLLASLAAIHESRTALELLRRRADDLQTFFDAFVDVVQSASAVADRKTAMTQLLHKIIRRLHAEECLIYLRSEEGQILERAFGTNNIKDIDLFENQGNGAIIEHVVQTGAPYLDNGYAFEIKVPFSTESRFIRSILCLPLICQDQKIGVIEVLNKVGGVFNGEDRALLEMLVGPLAVAIGTIHMFDDTERLTITDDLTKLYNYRFLMQYLEAEVKRCMRYKKRVSLLFIDVDGFKQINDTFGHLVGSRALAEIGQVLRRILRETDIVGRYGGDEFVVVLPETPLNGALVIAERIRKKIEDYEFVAQDLSIHLTISLGIANCPKHTLTAEGLIKKADAAMYRAKELTKNSIKVAV